jgi:hypothetical protein
MWKKLNHNLVEWKSTGVTNTFDEQALRHLFRSFLDDKSRSRYGGENACTDQHYLKSIEWFVRGLRTLMKDK